MKYFNKLILTCLSSAIFASPAYLHAAAVDHISHYGITWKFAKPVRAGQFANGEWWVAPNDGETAVTVVSVDPAPAVTSGGKHINGSMINPKVGWQAMDERGPVWKPELGVQYPLALKPNQSLLSTKSIPETHPAAKKTSNQTWVFEINVLTCLAKPALPTDFRPPYVGNDKPLYSTLNLRRDLLPDLAPPANLEIPDMKALLVARFSHPWMEFLIGYAVKELNSIYYESGYGRNKCAELGGASLFLCLDEKVVGDKDPILIGLVQTGIDLYHTLINGGNWHSNGGFNGGRKFPILFAGLMLGNKEMLDIGNKYPPESNTFQEDAQSFIITQEDVDRKHKIDITGLVKTAGPAEIGLPGKTADPAGVPGYTELKGNRIKIISGPGAGQVRELVGEDVWENDTTMPAVVDCKVNPPWDVVPEPGKSVFQVLGFQKEDIGKASWSSCHFSKPVKWLSPVVEQVPGVALMGADSSKSDNPGWYVGYGLSNKGAWVGEVLAARLLGLKKAWNADAVFLLEDQYMNDTAKGAPYYGKTAPVPRVYNMGSNDPEAPQFVVRGTFAEAMWDTYRPKADNIADQVTLKAASRTEISAADKASRNEARRSMLAKRQADLDAARIRDHNAFAERTTKAEAEAKAKPAPANTVLVVNATKMSSQGGGEVTITDKKRAAVGKAISQWDNEGHWLEWKFTVPAEGWYNLTLCYCSRDDQAVRQISINGEEQEPSAPIILPATGGYASSSDDWRLVTATNPVSSRPLLLKLKAGENTVRLTNANGRSANLNYVAITSPDVQVKRELLAAKIPAETP